MLVDKSIFFDAPDASGSPPPVPLAPPADSGAAPTSTPPVPPTPPAMTPEQIEQIVARKSADLEERNLSKIKIRELESQNAALSEKLKILDEIEKNPEGALAKLIRSRNLDMKNIAKGVLDEPHHLLNEDVKSTREELQKAREELARQNEETRTMTQKFIYGQELSEVLDSDKFKTVIPKAVKIWEKVNGKHGGIPAWVNYAFNQMVKENAYITPEQFADRLLKDSEATIKAFEEEYIPKPPPPPPPPNTPPNGTPPTAPSSSPPITNKSETTMSAPKDWSKATDEELAAELKKKWAGQRQSKTLDDAIKELNDEENRMAEVRKKNREITDTRRKRA